MLISVRTTVVIEDSLLRQAKRRAAALDTTLSEVISQALRESLRPRPRQDDGKLVLPTYGSPRKPVRHEPGELARLLEGEDLESLRR